MDNDISAYTYERTLMMEQRNQMLRELGLNKRDIRGVVSWNHFYFFVQFCEFSKYEYLPCDVYHFVAWIYWFFLVTNWHSTSLLIIKDGGLCSKGNQFQCSLPHIICLMICHLLCILSRPLPLPPHQVRTFCEHRSARQWDEVRWIYVRSIWACGFAIFYKIQNHILHFGEDWKWSDVEVLAEERRKVRSSHSMAKWDQANWYLSCVTRLNGAADEGSVGWRCEDAAQESDRC